ncbi:c-type cytochrome [Profundibacter sp.]
MKRVTLPTVIATLTIALGAPAFAGGDVTAGQKVFNKCKSCHTISNGDEVIVKGGKTGPNLYGVIGRQAGTYEGFPYYDSIIAAGQAGLVWDEEKIARWVQNPKAFLRDYLDNPKAHSAMTFRVRKGGADVAAYLASIGPQPEPEQPENPVELTN